MLRELVLRVLANKPVPMSVDEPHSGTIYKPTIAARAQQSVLDKFRSRREQTGGAKARLKPEASLERRLLLLRAFSRKYYPTPKGHSASQELYQLGVDRDLRDIFDINTEWLKMDLIPVFDPGFLSNRDVVECLTRQGVNVLETRDVMSFTGSEPSLTPTLHLIDNSPFPSLDTIGKSADDVNQEPCLSLRGYGLAQALNFFTDRRFIDDGRGHDTDFQSVTGEIIENKGDKKRKGKTVHPNTTWTLFPANRSGWKAPVMRDPGYGALVRQSDPVAYAFSEPFTDTLQFCCLYRTDRPDRKAGIRKVWTVAPK